MMSFPYRLSDCDSRSDGSDGSYSGSGDGILFKLTVVRLTAVLILELVEVSSHEVHSLSTLLFS